MTAPAAPPQHSVTRGGRRLCAGTGKCWRRYLQPTPAHSVVSGLGWQGRSESPWGPLHLRCAPKRRCCGCCGSGDERAACRGGAEPCTNAAVVWQLQRSACLLLLLLLLCSLAGARQSLPECCRQKTCSCRIYDLLHGMGNHAAGILTLGKRKSIPPAFQSRLYRLLHGSGNHAAGILTMGKREERPGTACRDAPSCAAGTQPTVTPRGAAASPRECQEHAEKDLTKGRGAAKSFY